MSMEDILASIRKMIAQDQDVMDATRADRDSGLPSEESTANDEVLDLIDATKSMIESSLRIIA